MASPIAYVTTHLELPMNQKIVVTAVVAGGLLLFGATGINGDNSSKIQLANIAVLTLLATTCGAKNSPFNKLVFWFNDGPISFPVPGAVNLSAHN